MPKMINNICEYYPRTKMIVDVAKKYQEEKRSILILSDRRDHLNLLAVMLNDFCTTGFYVGGMKPDELRESQEKDILLATFSMASEGMDVPKLNTVILASPKSDVEQSVGRIFREKACDRTHHPLIIDIIESKNVLICVEPILNAVSFKLLMTSDRSFGLEVEVFMY